MIPITPPRAAIARITASDLQRGLAASVRQFEWVISTGCREAAKASRLVRSEQWETSTTMPARFIAATISAPKGVSPVSCGSKQPLPMRLRAL